ncbi:hypothetical protein HK405_012535 [Cladochytrium tenue]|nr:hypothetical protein HK405_012535 [Cladochytrium tenue]
MASRVAAATASLPAADSHPSKPPGRHPPRKQAQKHRNKSEDRTGTPDDAATGQPQDRSMPRTTSRGLKSGKKTKRSASNPAAQASHQESSEAPPTTALGEESINAHTTRDNILEHAKPISSYKGGDEDHRVLDIYEMESIITDASKEAHVRKAIAAAEAVIEAALNEEDSEVDDQESFFENGEPTVDPTPSNLMSVLEAADGAFEEDGITEGRLSSELQNIDLNSERAELVDEISSALGVGGYFGLGAGAMDSSVLADPEVADALLDGMKRLRELRGRVLNSAIDDTASRERLEATLAALRDRNVASQGRAAGAAEKTVTSALERASATEVGSIYGRGINDPEVRRAELQARAAELGAQRGRLEGLRTELSRLESARDELVGQKERLMRAAGLESGEGGPGYTRANLDSETGGTSSPGSRSSPDRRLDTLAELQSKQTQLAATLKDLLNRVSSSYGVETNFPGTASSPDRAASASFVESIALDHEDFDYLDEPQLTALIGQVDQSIRGLMESLEESRKNEMEQNSNGGERNIEDRLRVPIYLSEQISELRESLRGMQELKDTYSRQRFLLALDSILQEIQNDSIRSDALDILPATPGNLEKNAKLHSFTTTPFGKSLAQSNTRPSSTFARRKRGYFDSEDETKQILLSLVDETVGESKHLGHDHIACIAGHLAAIVRVRDGELAVNPLSPKPRRRDESGGNRAIESVARTAAARLAVYVGAPVAGAARRGVLRAIVEDCTEFLSPYLAPQQRRNLVAQDETLYASPGRALPSMSGRSPTDDQARRTGSPRSRKPLWRSGGSSPSSTTAEAATRGRSNGRSELLGGTIVADADGKRSDVLLRAMQQSKVVAAASEPVVSGAVAPAAHDASWAFEEEAGRQAFAR